MAKIQINGVFYEVKTDRNLLQTCIALGFDIPYFCYHPALGSVGACRLCAVKKFANADDKNGRIVMSCMEPVSDGLIISVDHPDVKDFRAAVIEGLMTNHPHDCPICDEGGECHLQDMTVMTGHNYRKFVFKKRTYENQYLGPFIQHEMNRCIQCYRCVRFYKDYAGGKDLNVFGSANHVYFGRDQDGILESEFSGNLVEVCPTGVFTDKTLKRHFTRKWDLTNAPSVCVHCSLGCNTILSERYGSVRRTMSRYNNDVNGYFLCDRGRFGYEFINDPDRIKKIWIRRSKNGSFEEAENQDLFDINPKLADRKKTIGIGSPRASLEANYALSALVGMENFFHGISANEQTLVKIALRLLENASVQVLSLKEIEKYDAVFVMGEDVTNTAPMMALAIRQSLRNKSVGLAEKMGIPKWNDAAVRVLNHEIKSPVFIASPYSTKLDELAEGCWHAAPADIARLGFAVASSIHSGAPRISHPDKMLKEMSGKIAEALITAQNPLIITGTSLGSTNILHAVENIIIALSLRGKKPGISIALPECNSAGLGMMEGDHLGGALDLITKDKVDTLIILENDLYRRVPEGIAGIVFDKVRQVIVLDHLMHSTAKRADILLPAATYAESAGTIVNNEGRSQRYYPVMPAARPVRESWDWIAGLVKSDQDRGSWQNFDEVVSAMVNAYPALSGIKDHLPHADYRYSNEKIARQPMRFSGRTAMNANISVSEPKPPDDPDSPLSFSMEGYKGSPRSSLIPYYWSPGWNSPQSINKYLEEPDGILKNPDPGVRLLIQTKNPAHEYHTPIPDPFGDHHDELLFIPVHRIFGSEELSSKGQAIAGLIPKPFFILNRKEADRLKIIDNGNYSIEINQVIIQAAVKMDDYVPDGVAGLSCLLPGMPYVDLPGRGRVIQAG